MAFTCLHCDVDQSKVTEMKAKPTTAHMQIAKERAEKAELVGNPNNAVFHHMSLYDVAQLGRTYDYINCVSIS